MIKAKKYEALFCKSDAMLVLKLNSRPMASCHRPQHMMTRKTSKNHSQEPLASVLDGGLGTFFGRFLAVFGGVGELLVFHRPRRSKTAGTAPEAGPGLGGPRGRLGDV